MLKKLTSRKFLLTILPVIVGIATSFSGVGGRVGLISGLVATVIPCIIYVITEGNIDAKAVGMITDAIPKVIDSIKDEETK